MLTDSITTTPSFSYDPTVDDFFNLDVLNSAPSAFTASSSSSSPRSPFIFSTPNGADDDFFAQFLDTDELTKGPSLPSLSVPSYDFFGATEGGASASGSSPESIDANTPMFAIDPQLVGTPATSNDNSDQDSNSDQELEQELAPPKRSRRGAVASGGIKKSYSPSEKDLNSGAGKSKSSKDPAPLKILEPEDWRPSPEEYKKMSSREKRQLRNKISARNFRVRRKEYITTLEGDIAERDRLIDAIRSELGSSRSENTALRQEISALKRCLLESRHTPDLPPPAELQTGAPLSPPGSPVPTPVTVSSTTPLITPNTQKDLPTSPRLGARPFWGGFGGMGVTPVHTTLIPPVGVKGVLQENINPTLHRPSSIVEKTNGQLNGLGMGVGLGIGTFDAFADTNPFTLKTLDAYRMQLWGKMAAQHAHANGNFNANTHGMGYTSHGLASGLKPAYFASPPSSKSQGLSGKNAYPSPPPSPAFKAAPVPTREQAAFAAIASQTLLGKLGSAFWEAFSGSGAGSGVGGSGSMMRKEWDADKVRKVLDGRAVVRVVDLDEPVPNKFSPSLMVPSNTMERKPSLPLGKAEKSQPSGTGAEPTTCACRANMCDILEESMRSLTISKK